MGFAVGNERLLAALTRVKSYLDYGAFTPIQVAATAALNGPDDCIHEMRAIYKKRREALVDSFGKAGWKIPAPAASMFAWVPIPERYRSMGSLEFSKLLLEKSDVAVAPASASASTGTITSASPWSRTSSASVRPRATCAGSSTRQTSPCTTSCRSRRRSERTSPCGHPATGLAKGSFSPAAALVRRRPPAQGSCGGIPSRSREPHAPSVHHRRPAARRRLPRLARPIPSSRGIPFRPRADGCLCLPVAPDAAERLRHRLPSGADLAAGRPPVPRLIHRVAFVRGGRSATLPPQLSDRSIA